MTQIELEAKIKTAQEAYYNGEPIMSDADFDTLWDTLSSLYPDSSLLNEVGSDLGESNGFPKVKHNIIMGSQSKANTKEEMAAFFSKCKPGKFIAQHKMDGSSLCIDYVDGKLVRAASRGDGTVGVDYTPNVIKMMGVPQRISPSFTGSVRGEVLLSNSNKEKYFADMANARNAATGIFHHIDGEDCDKLTVVAYDAQYLNKDISFGTQEKLQKWLEDNKFIVAPYKVIDGNTDEAMKILSENFSEEARSNWEFDIDGIVFKQNEIDMADITTNYRPKTQIALKPARTIVKTTLNNIEWQVRNGTLTPVAILEPVNLLGATISRASLCNVAMLENMGIEIGHEVCICRTGEIIPKIIKDCATGKFAEGYEF